MEKLILMSVIVATMVAPVIAARDRVPVRGVKRLVSFLALFYVGYLAMLVLVYTKNYVPEWMP